MTELITQLRSLLPFNSPNIANYRSSINLYLDCGKYKIKTAQSAEDLKKCLILRNLIFNIEYCGVDKKLDIDQFDNHFDHLMILNNESDQLIGTYRLKTNTNLKNSYTESEFNLNSLFQINGPYLELGRACIHPEFRKGSIISLLWRGISEYMKITQAKVLFGCSSVKIDNPRDAAILYMYLSKNNFLDSTVFCYPQKKFIMPDLNTWLLYFEKNYGDVHSLEAEKIMPSLLKSYLKYGAKIMAAPAFDKEFNCIDFLTVMRKEDLANCISQKYNLVNA